MDPVTTVAVARLPGGVFALTWDDTLGRAPVTVRAALDVDTLATAPVAATGDGRVEVAQLAPGARHYFLLQPAGGGEPLVVAERAVTFAGGVNFRDVGGYRSEDGRRVRWGRLFRSGHMANFTASDKDTFAALGIRTVCDFRLAEERAAEASDLPGPPQLHVLGIEPGLGDKFFFHRLFERTDDPRELMDAMRAMLVSLVRGVASRYGRLFEVLLEDPPGAVLMNCSAGKERTGIGVALVLSALGVPRETILYDFMLSGTYFPAEAEVPRVLEKYGVKRRGEAGRALIMPLLETHAEFLEAAFAAIDLDFGSSAAFLTHHFGLGPAECARLRDIYTVRGEDLIT